MKGYLMKKNKDTMKPVLDIHSMGESPMSPSHNVQDGSPNVQKSEGSLSKASRREFLKLAAAASAAALSASDGQQLWNTKCHASL
jgi:hypothetical protein